MRSKKLVLNTITLRNKNKTKKNNKDKWFEIHNLNNVLMCRIVLYFLII